MPMQTIFINPNSNYSKYSSEVWSRTTRKQVSILLIRFECNLCKSWLSREFYGENNKLKYAKIKILEKLTIDTAL